MLRNKICDILYKVQQSTSCHQKYRQILINLYNETPFADFEPEFMRCIEHMFGQDAQHKNVYVERCLEFSATFVTTVVLAAEKKYESQDTNDTEDDIQTHPLLEAIIDNVLQYHNLDYVSVRYRSCQFLNLLLRNLGDDAHIDVDVGNAIQVAMLERLEDIKPFIRLQAVKALVRLQQPENSDCPVIKALLSHLYESSALVRKEIVDALAATPVIVPKIAERVRDSDYNVRLAAYRKCSMLGPRLISIVSRQLIVESGFSEENELVKRCFLEDTLPKWLSVYNGNFLQLLHALKLDAYEEDLKRTETISKKVLEVFFKSQQLNSLIEYLPIDENKLIPVEKLTTEAVLYWCILTNYLRTSDSTEDYLDDIIPELIHFCAYVERVFKEYNNKSMQDWQYLEYQQILCQLLQMIGQYDLSDEVGRKALHKLIVDMLMTGKFNNRVITEMIAILEKINPILDSLTIDICHIISDIRQPLIEQPPSQEMKQQNEFKKAEVRVKINILSDERDEAVAKCDYEAAAVIKKQLIELKKQLEDIDAQFEAARTMVRSSQNNPETLCRCLDILIGMLSSPSLKTLTASLRSCKDEFVTPLLENTNLEIHQRVFKCIALYCTLDRQLTCENLKLICTPIVVYRLLPQYDKPVIMTSIAAVSDLLRLFGTDIFSNTNGNGNNETNSTNISKRRLNSTRRLYTVCHAEDLDTVDFDSIGYEDVVDILLDMLDDESQDLREQAGRALGELVMSKIAVSPSLISRMIVKWFNPMTEKHDQRLQQLLGNTFVYFAQHVENSEDVLEKAVIPVLTSIGNAPRTSPLADIDLDNTLRFLAAITCIQKQSGFVNTHKNLAYSLCYKILSAKPEERKCVFLYTKMLLHLELYLEDPVVIRELINQAELILKDLTERVPKRNVEKFAYKLKKLLEESANQENETIEGNQSEGTSRSSVLQPLDRASEISLAQQSDNSSRTTMLDQTISNRNMVQNKNDDKSNTNSTSATKRKSDSPKDNVTEELQDNTDKLSKISLNETPTVKRRRRRGRKSKEVSIEENDKDEETILHTIVETEEHEMGSLEHNSTIDTSIITEKLRQSTDKLSNISLSETSSVKRRTHRGRKSSNATADLTGDEETMLHTIIEPSEHEMGSLENESTIDTSIITKQTRKSTNEISDTSSNGTSSVKRRKRRGRKSNAVTVDVDKDEETVLHTIIEPDEHEMGSLENDSTIDSSISTRETQKSTDKCESSNTSLNGTSSAKRRTRRGRKSRNATVDLTGDEETILRTIIEPSEPEMGSLEADSTIDTSIITRQTRKSTNALSDTSSNGTSSVKRRKRRGRKGNAVTVDVDKPDEHEVESLEDDDLTIQSLTTSISSTSSSGSGKRGRPKKIVTSETSSDSEAPKKKAQKNKGVRRSSRSISKTKKYSP